VKVNQPKAFFPTPYFDKSPVPPKTRTVNELMLQFKESKDNIVNQSPVPPMLALLKKNSSVGDHPFWGQQTPNRNEPTPHVQTIGLCKSHFAQSGLLNYVGDVESISDDEKPMVGVPEFSVEALEKDD
jgi:hypothetical protein